MWALGALSAAAGAGLLRLLAAESGTAEALGRRGGIPTPIAHRLLDVLVALGLATREGATYSATPGLTSTVADREVAERFNAELDNSLLQAADLASRARGHGRSPLDLAGWRHEDPDILRSQGITSAGAVPQLVDRAFPMLDLTERMTQPGARALDVGTGVAAIAIGLAQRFPDLHVVGLEPAPAPMAEARRNVLAAGLEHRIELRAQRVEDLGDVDTYDYAFLPNVFLPMEVLRTGLQCVLRALRPGGWVTMGSLGVPGDELGPALARLKATLWGSEALAPEEIGRIAEEVGYDEVRFFPGPPGSTLVPIAARKAPVAA